MLFKIMSSPKIHFDKVSPVHKKFFSLTCWSKERSWSTDEIYFNPNYFYKFSSLKTNTVGLKLVFFKQQGSVIVGGECRREQSSQFNNSVDLLLDRYGNLYVIDKKTHCIQRFSFQWTYSLYTHIFVKHELVENLGLIWCRPWNFFEGLCITFTNY